MATAKKLFAQKGYDATSMDEIALQNNVPKSLIYYHFKNKEDLLQAVIELFFLEYEQVLRSDNQENNKMGDFLGFLENNSDFLHVILTESLKKNNTASYAFKVIELLLKFESESSDNKDLADYSKNHQRWVAEFFTSVIPCVLFTCYKRKWCDHFNTDEKTFEQDFISAYWMTHGEYHKKLVEKEKY